MPHQPNKIEARKQEVTHKMEEIVAIHKSNMHGLYIE